MSNTDAKKLFTDFAPVSTEQWMDKIQADLKGASFEKKLVWKTLEGFSLQPFYRAEDLQKLNHLNTEPGKFPFLRGNQATTNTWLVREKVPVKDLTKANAKALELLTRGVDSLCFCISNKELVNDNLLPALLKGIPLEEVEVNFCGSSMPKVGELFVAYTKSQHCDLAKVRGSIDFDPLGHLLCSGSICTSFEEHMKRAASLIELSADLKQFRVLAVNASLFNNAGGLITQELAYGLAMGSEYMSRLTDLGVSAALVAKNIKFNFGVSANYFLEIGKFRAARALWSEIVAAYKPECSSDCDSKTPEGYCACACKMIIHAETSKWNMTIYDAQVNMLRTQTEAMSAAIGGVHSMTVLPYDTIFRDTTEISERIARNQQLLLKEEAHFDKVVDPGAGSYYIEQVTAKIMTQAWELFLDTENKGGMYKAMEAGIVQEQVEAVAETRKSHLAQRREILLGTNQYPNFEEFVAKQQTGGSACNCGCGAEQMVKPLNLARGAEAFEHLRLQVEASAKRPVAFMLKVGNLAMRQARAQFACNFFACAGYKVVENLGYNSVAEGIKAAKAAGADIVVLCSSDDEYVTFAPESKAALDKEIFVVAGAPACMEDLQKQGVDNFIHVRSNVLSELIKYNNELGIS